MTYCESDLDICDKNVFLSSWDFTDGTQEEYPEMDITAYDN